MNNNENAAIRFSYVSDIYQSGVVQTKQQIMNKLDTRFVKLHNDGYLHIHDLEAFGKVYNCSIPNIKNCFDEKEFEGYSEHGRILEVFNWFKNLIVNLATNQSGGIGFANFDKDMSECLTRLNIPYNNQNSYFFDDCMMSFIKWINTSYTRYCREPYYLTFNLGLSTSAWGRKTTNAIITSFYNSVITFMRPNIVFKVNRKINSVEGTPNFDLYELSFNCTAKRMIPTYLLTDSIVNKECDINEIGIMGCRTSVSLRVTNHKVPQPLYLSGIAALL